MYQRSHLNNPQIQNIAISCEENEQGILVYQAHVFMAPPDFRVIKLEECQTQKAAQKSAEDFLKLLGSLQQSMQEESDRA